MGPNDTEPCRNAEDFIFYPKNKNSEDFKKQVTSFFSFWLLVQEGLEGRAECEPEASAVGKRTVVA